jgi:hypothetical protein
VTDLNTHTTRVSPLLPDVSSDATSLSGAIKPVRYRYVMAYLQETEDPPGSGIIRQPGEVMAVLPMTSVSYSVGFYAGTDVSGSVYLPEMWLDLMSHQPLNTFKRRIHPDQQGMPIGALFECGNRALYVMRNEEVVWGGILWSRQYSSGSPTLTITGLSWEGYAYYRALRQSVVFYTPTNVYKIWHTVLNQMLNDFTLTGASNGEVTDGILQISTEVSQSVKWTGISRGSANAAARPFIETWPNNSPDITMPPSNLLWKKGSPAVEAVATVEETFRGYEMPKVGEVLAQWADTETIASATGPSDKTRFEYRVVCWFDETQQRFRQRYVFGEMSYGSDPHTPTGIISGLIGKNTQEMVDSDQNSLVFDFPGHISEWSLGESMEEATTRVLVTGGDGDAAEKLAEYTSQSDLLGVPPTGSSSTIGRRGWRLYDRILGTDLGTPSTMLTRGQQLLALCHVPQAAQINDLAAANRTAGQRVSQRSTDLSITLYTDPTTPFPDWGIGDWATFAIEDPFYGGKMYLQRRIIGYSVTVVPEQESDYSHEQITLELTDQTHIGVD